MHPKLYHQFPDFQKGKVRAETLVKVSLGLQTDCRHPGLDRAAMSSLAMACEGRVMLLAKTAGRPNKILSNMAHPRGHP